MRVACILPHCTVTEYGRPAHKNEFVELIFVIPFRLRAHQQEDCSRQSSLQLAVANSTKCVTCTALYSTDIWLKFNFISNRRMDICVSHGLEYLPDELIIRIFSWLTTADLMRIHSIPNKRMKSLSVDRALFRYSMIYFATVISVCCSTCTKFCTLPNFCFLIKLVWIAIALVATFYLYCIS